MINIRPRIRNYLPKRIVAAVAAAALAVAAVPVEAHAGNIEGAGVIYPGRVGVRATAAGKYVVNTGPYAKYADISPWAAELVSTAILEGLAPVELQRGYTDAISRAEFCALLVTAYEKINCAQIEDRMKFSDTDDEYVEKAAAIGVMAGVGDDMFEPGETLSREQAAVAFARFMELFEYPARDCIASFSDNADISAWAFRRVGRMQAAGVMTGDDGNNFRPLEPYTKEQSIISCMRAYDAVLNYLVSGPAQEQQKIPIGDPQVKGKRIPILMYHAVADAPHTSLTELFVRESEMEAQLKYIVENGFQTITFEDLDNIGEFSKPVMLTFDDGYHDNYTNLYPLLKKYGCKATVFMIANAVYSDEFMSRDELAEVSETGLISVQSHTLNHKQLPQLSKNDLNTELSESKAMLEEITGRPVVALGYPIGKTNDAVASAASEYYEYAARSSGGKFTCGGNPMTMSRIYVKRGLSVASFAALIN